MRGTRTRWSIVSFGTRDPGLPRARLEARAGGRRKELGRLTMVGCAASPRRTIRPDSSTQSSIGSRSMNAVRMKLVGMSTRRFTLQQETTRIRPPVSANLKRESKRGKRTSRRAGRARQSWAGRPLPMSRRALEGCCPRHASRPRRRTASWRAVTAYRQYTHKRPTDRALNEPRMGGKDRERREST